MYYTGGMSKMGRPKTPASQIQSCMINVRVTPSQRAALRRMAGKQSLTEFIRGVLFEGAAADLAARTRPLHQ